MFPKPPEYPECLQLGRDSRSAAADPAGIFRQTSSVASLLIGSSLDIIRNTALLPNASLGDAGAKPRVACTPGCKENRRRSAIRLVVEPYLANTVRPTDERTVASMQGPSAGLHLEEASRSGSLRDQLEMIFEESARGAAKIADLGQGAEMCHHHSIAAATGCR